MSRTVKQSDFKGSREIAIAANTVIGFERPKRAKRRWYIRIWNRLKNWWNDEPDYTKQSYD